MGTSASYGGPSGNNPLLPPWAPPPTDGEPMPPASPGPDMPPSDQGQPGLESPPSPQPPTATPIPWAGPKASLSRFASSLSGRGGMGGRGHLRSATRGFVRAQGGARGAARAASAGRASVQKLGGFLTQVITEGTDAAARSLGLQQFVGQDANTLLVALVDQIAPSGALLEDAAAREATIQTLDELFQEYAVQDNGFESLNSLDVEGITHALERYVANYIYTRLVQVISQRLESRSTDEVIQVEKEVKDYVFPTVHLDLMRRTDVLSITWNGKEGYEFVERIYQEGYELIERIL